MTRGHEAELSPILKEFNGWVTAEEPIPRRACWIAGSSAICYACKSSRQWKSSRCCCVRGLLSRRFVTVSEAGKLKTRPCSISTPGVTVSGSICSGCRELWCRLLDRLRTPHRCAGCGAALGRGISAGDPAGHRTSARTVEGAAGLLIAPPTSVFILFL